MVGDVAGGGRRWPETAGSGRRWVAKVPSPINGGASVVEMVKMEFFGNEASEKEAIARWKEYDEEKKMVCLVVIKVV